MCILYEKWDLNCFVGFLLLLLLKIIHRITTIAAHSAHQIHYQVHTTIVICCIQCIHHLHISELKLNQLFLLSFFLFKYPFGSIWTRNINLNAFTIHTHTHMVERNALFCHIKYWKYPETTNAKNNFYLSLDRPDLNKADKWTKSIPR